ncbi:spermatogenesis associated 6-like protein isoform X1 [Psammomys obesus]|uniref:spermatogenesis associated 6-like protein isoform X1 n=1 Tax=Psammomys obesus TaxID=48139 RepID=UPI0024535FB7|nr:spermatogenesis associated 6-like protein isoform X1 [Psammomys obesus]XP_055470040.1 spermatogenesis associated 6-like protein isoform X1 [Psammomys obesus]
MPLEVVVELQIRAISCPGVFLPVKEDVYLGVYLLNQYLETDCFPSVFPIAIQQNMRFEKVFENAVDPGAVAELLENFLTRFELIQLSSPEWEELAYYEENTRDFLFPEPKLTSSHLGMQREVLMKTAVDFPGIAPKLEFSTRTAIRECVFPQRNRFFEENCKPHRPLWKLSGQRVPASNKKMKAREKSPDQLAKGTQFQEYSPPSRRRLLLHQPTQLKKSFKFPGERKPPFVVRHVDNQDPFGENNLTNLSQKSRRKSKILDFDFSLKRASSLDSFAANIKVIREPDERIVLRSQSPLDSTKSRRSWLSHQGDADFYPGTSVASSPLSRPTSPLDQPLRRERFQPCFQSSWKTIRERDDIISEKDHIYERPNYPLMKHVPPEQRYF